MNRLFTHADIVAFFQKHYASASYPVYALEKIELLPELTPPTWRVKYQATYGSFISLHSFLLVQYTREDGTPFLNLPGEIAVPVGLASVAEEDDEIKRRHEEVLAKWHATQQGVNQ